MALRSTDTRPATRGSPARRVRRTSSVVRPTRTTYAGTTTAIGSGEPLTSPKTRRPVATRATAAEMTTRSSFCQSTISAFALNPARETVPWLSPRSTKADQRARQLSARDHQDGALRLVRAPGGTGGVGEVEEDPKCMTQLRLQRGALTGRR